MESELLSFIQIGRRIAEPRACLIAMAKAGLFRVYEGSDDYYAWWDEVRQAFNYIQRTRAVISVAPEGLN